MNIIRFGFVLLSCGAGAAFSAHVEADDARCYKRRGTGLIYYPGICIRKMAWLAYHGAEVNPDDSSSDAYRRSPRTPDDACSVDFFNYARKIDLENEKIKLGWRKCYVFYRDQAQDKVRMLALRGARLSPEGEILKRETLAMIHQVQEQRCEAIDQVLIEERELPKVLANLVCQFSDDVALQDSIMARHNAFHGECVRNDVCADAENLIRDFSSDQLRPWKRRLLKSVM